MHYDLMSTSPLDPRIIFVYFFFTFYFKIHIKIANYLKLFDH